MADVHDGVEGIGETVGEARWRALRELRVERPDLDEQDVEFEVVSEGDRTVLGRVAAPARVVARVRGAEARPVVEEPAADAAEDAGHRALRDALEVVLGGLGIRGARVTIAEGEDEELRATVEAGDLAGFIGRNGQTIDAVQFLAAQIVSRAEGGSHRRVIVDAGGYRERRRLALESLAHRAAREALEHGEEIELDPMSPQDRRIVHIALKEEARVVTRSEGVEPNRRIIVEPAE